MVSVDLLIAFGLSEETFIVIYPLSIVISDDISLF